MMEQCQRTDPPYAAGEKEMASAFLDWQRDTLLCKVAGLSDEELRRRHEPSGLTLLGLVKHLAAVEMIWFQARFAGATETEIPQPVDWEAYWRIEPHETTAGVLELYRRQVERSRAITAAAVPDDQARSFARHPELTLRWILLHMIEETGRHNGHADLIREAIDGQTGE
jgi:uncharacterized damage-inducible protein DinB